MLVDKNCLLIKHTCLYIRHVVSLENLSLTFSKVMVIKYNNEAMTRRNQS